MAIGKWFKNIFGGEKSEEKTAGATSKSAEKVEITDECPDGRVEEEETAYIGRFMGNNFGPEVEKESMDVLRKLVAKHQELHNTKPMAFIQLIGDLGQQMSKTLSDDLRYQLLSMLVMISKSDANLDEKELEALHDVAIYMGMKGQQVDELLDLDPELAKKGWPDLNLRKD